MEEQKTASIPAVGKPRPSGKTIALRILIGLGIAAALFVIVVLVWLVVVKYIKKEPVPYVMGYATLYVTTGSMTGTIDRGSIIVVKRTNSYEVGDIITFLPADSAVPTTHRIVDIKDGLYYTKGDANNTVDPFPITYGEICGEVVSVLRGLGMFLGWLGEGGWLFIAAAVIVIVLAIIIWKRLDAPPAPEVVAEVSKTTEPVAAENKMAEPDVANDQTVAPDGQDKKEGTTHADALAKGECAPEDTKTLRQKEGEGA